MEDKNVERNSENGGLACEVPEVSLSLLKMIIVQIRNLWSWLPGPEESAVLNKIAEPLKRNHFITGTIDAGRLKLRN